MLRQLVSGPGCVDDTGASGPGNPLQAFYSTFLQQSKQREHLPELRFRDSVLADVNKEKVRTRSNVHLRHVFPGMVCDQSNTLTDLCSPVMFIQLGSALEPDFVCRCKSSAAPAAAALLLADSQYL